MTANIQGAELIVEAGFGFGALETVTTWVDITSDFRAGEFATGRQFELDRIEAGTGTMVLDNRGGDWSPDNTAGTHYPDVRSSTPIRISAIWDSVTYRLFYGKLEDIPLMFPEVVDATVEVTFSDILEVLSTARLPATTAEETLAAVPRAYWRFGSTADSGPEGDHTLTLTNTPTEDETGAWTDDVAMSFDESASESATAADGAADLDNVGALTISMWINRASTDGNPRGIVSRGTFYNQSYTIITAGGGVQFEQEDGDAAFPATSRSSYFGSMLVDTWYHIAFTRAADGVTVTCYQDGVSQGSDVMASPPSGSSADTVIATSPYGQTFDGLISELAIFDRVLTADEIAAIASAKLEPRGEERTDERIAGMLALAGVTNTDLEQGQSTMAASTAVAGASIRDEIGKATDTEAGVLFIEGDGTVRFHDRHYRVEDQASSNATFGPSNISFQDMVAGRYIAQLINEAYVTPGDSASPAFAEDATSVAAHGRRSRSITTYPANPAEATDHAAYLVALFKDNATRVASISFDLGVDTDAWAAVLGAEIGDRFTVQKTMAGDDINAEVFLEAITHTITAQKTWRVTWDLSPAGPASDFWVLDSASHSQLDSTTILNF